MTFIQRAFPVVLTALLTLPLTGCPMGGHGHGNTATGQKVGGVTVGQAIPDFAVRDLKGRRKRLSDFRGKVVLLDIWASWCAPCKVELPMLDDIAGRQARKGIEILAVSVDTEEAKMHRFIEKRKGWKVSFFHDPDSRVPDLLQPPKMPTSYVIDRKGVVRMVNQGFDPGDAKVIENKLVELAGG